MDRVNKILVFLSLYLQSHIMEQPKRSAARVQHLSVRLIPSLVTPIRTPTATGTAEPRSSFEWRVGTYCEGTTALFTHWTEGGSGYSSSMICNGDCVAVKFCDDSIGVSSGFSTLFVDDPTDWDTTTESTTTTSESTSESLTTVTDSESSTETETTSSATFPSSTSEPEEAESPTDEGTKGGGGPSGGVIAGAVVGSIAGVALIVGVIILAFKMGRRSRGDDEGPGAGFRDSLRSIPMPTSGSHQPEPKPTVPVIQPVFVEESQPYRNNSEN
ncbi:uncharacterized protein FTJAE_4556 [Fusarium tjaetaba]|uniref:Uncharacterized protein n=1 Tax=Fusarium tjaetaba TaxID=1567544 RepID=A0A8H5VZC4_9HYPO|nr:uncharacterized protein FTJAE_4556 [Fusarium tjaetaba]KAF5640010.1 hypothetical protein FTJAE_4556 [Fusarium tjaetaba]